MTIEKSRKSVNDTRHGGGQFTQAEVAQAVERLDEIRRNRPLKPPSKQVGK